ncbi:MAG: TolC family protein [Candidatus Hydrogenedentota bacterium]|nr:MAG: TolC family protein [Candidatus Hydrogenedentota bacterium]
MNIRRFVSMICPVFFFLSASSLAFGQENTTGKAGLPADQDRLGLWDSPEDFMKLSYETPASPSRLILRTSEQGTTSEYGVFYFSDDKLLSSFIDAAIYANPAIGESEHRWRAALQRVPQATTLPDPEFAISQFIHKPETRVGPQDTLLSISQKFPWFGKLDARGEMALRDALAAAEQYQAQIREIVAAVKRAYYDLAYLDEAIRITRQDRELLEHFEEIAETRYATGKGIQQAVVKIQAEITRDDDRLYLLTQQRESIAANLNSLMDRSPHEPIPSLVKLSVVPVDTDLEQLYAKGRVNRHELKAAQYIVEKSDQAIRLAKKEFLPDFTIGFNYIFVDDRKDALGKLEPPEDNGRDAYGIALGFNIPLWEGKLMSGVREAREIKSASERSYDGIENAIEFSIRDAVLRAETTFDQLALYESVLIPQAEQSLDSTEAAYATGQLNALDLIDSERFLLNVRLAHAKLKTDYMKSLADIERAIGTAFPTERM